MCESVYGSTVFVCVFSPVCESVGPRRSAVCVLFDSRVRVLYTTARRMFKLVSVSFLVFDLGRESGSGLVVVTVCVVCEGFPVLGVDALLLDWGSACELR